jgi:hypothetical protein
MQNHDFYECLSRSPKDQKPGVSSDPARVDKACQTPMLMVLAIVWTEPSTKAAFTDPG